MEEEEETEPKPDICLKIKVRDIINGLYFPVSHQLKAFLSLFAIRAQVNVSEQYFCFSRSPLLSSLFIFAFVQIITLSFFLRELKTRIYSLPVSPMCLYVTRHCSSYRSSSSSTLQPSLSCWPYSGTSCLHQDQGTSCMHEPALTLSISSIHLDFGFSCPGHFWTRVLPHSPRLRYSPGTSCTRLDAETTFIQEDIGTSCAHLYSSTSCTRLDLGSSCKHLDGGTSFTHFDLGTFPEPIQTEIFTGPTCLGFPAPTSTQKLSLPAFTQVLPAPTLTQVLLAPTKTRVFSAPTFI